jgi:hypothetical protein
VNNTRVYFATLYQPASVGSESLMPAARSTLTGKSPREYSVEVCPASSVGEREKQRAGDVVLGRGSVDREPAAAGQPGLARAVVAARAAGRDAAVERGTASPAAQDSGQQVFHGAPAGAARGVGERPAQRFGVLTAEDGGPVAGGDEFAEPPARLPRVGAGVHSRQPHSRTAVIICRMFGARQPCGALR